MFGVTIAILAQAVAASPPAATTPATTVPAAEKIICRTYDVIGSLVKKERVCKTKTDWHRTKDTMDGELKRIIGPLPGPGQ